MVVEHGNRSLQKVALGATTPSTVLEKPAMNNSNTNWQSSSATGSPDNPTFIDLTKPQVVDVKQLEQCAEQHTAPNPQNAETAVYHLIGRVDGVISRGPAPTQNDDGACVLYMNADGEAFERHIPAVEGDWSDIPRTMVAPVGHTQATKWMQMAYEQATEAHAEVDFRAGADILVADNGAEIMTDGGRDSFEADCEAQLGDRQTEPMPGGVAIDLVTRQPLFVRREKYSNLGEHYDAEGYNLLTYKTHPYLPVTADDSVFECVFVNGNPEGIHKVGQTYDFPAGRLAHYPVEQAWGDE